MSAISATGPSWHGSPQPSPWHSPVPYLFGGLAAMLGLIAFALLILACSYWKLSGHMNNDDDDLESNNNSVIITSENDQNNRELCDMEEKYFVIMAGEAKPTFLATPISSSRTTSFGSSSWRSKLSSLNEKSSSSSENQENSLDDHRI